MSDDVYLHVGVPKSGTTYVQEVLWTNLDRLRDLGWSLAASSFDEHSRAAADLTGIRSGGSVTGAWDRQVDRIQAADGPVVLSRESLVRARSAQAERAVRSLAPRRVTVVVTARDLARQVASSWQQQVKQRFSGTLHELATAIIDRGPVADEFWETQDLPAVIDCWLGRVPAERVVVVTVPRAGSPPELLWERFASACGLDHTGFDLDITTPNESLGGVQTELLRRVNVALRGRLTLDDGYLPLVRRLVANDLLARQVSYEHFGVDEATHAWATSMAHEWAAGLRERGVTVVGELDELAPSPFAPTHDPSASDEGAVAAAATELLADLLAQWRDRGRAMPRRAPGQPRDAGAHRRSTVRETDGAAGSGGTGGTRAEADA